MLHNVMVESDGKQSRIIIYSRASPMLPLFPVTDEFIPWHTIKKLELRSLNHGAKSRHHDDLAEKLYNDTSLNCSRDQKG